MSEKFRVPDTIFRMRTVFSLILICSASIAVPLFIFLWNHMWDAWKVAQHLPLFDWGKDALIEQIRIEALNYDLPAYGEDVNPEDFSTILTLIDNKTGISFYGEEDGYYRMSFYPEDLISHQYGSVLQHALEIASIPSIQDPPQTVRFGNGETASLYLIDYHCIAFIYPYIAVSTLLCIAVFLAPVLLYISSRIRHIHLLNREITLMASGDLSHPVPPTGRDEIGSLGASLDQLRLALSSNFRQEEETRKSNQDLITSMSHDLRTPLTILNGYLEVMKMGRQTQEGREDYISRCIRKVADIRALTDRMFEYALVYEVDETPEFTELPVSFLEQCLTENLDYIRLAGFTADTPLFPQSGIIYGDETMLKRVFTNLFSNVLKYGKKQTAVHLELSPGESVIRIRISNGIREDRSGIASNQIGLKSVQKIIDLHHGTVSAEQQTARFADDSSVPKNGRLFSVELTLPLYDAVSKGAPAAQSH